MCFVPLIDTNLLSYSHNSWNYPILISVFKVSTDPTSHRPSPTPYDLRDYRRPMLHLPVPYIRDVNYRIL